MSLVKTTAARSLRNVFAIMLLVAFPFFAVSQQLSVEENTRKMQVRYLEGNNETLHFIFKYNNDTGDGFKLMVLNENDEVLFQNNYSGKNFKKKIKLPRLTDTDGVTFLIRSSRQNVQLSRTVKITSKVVDQPEEQDEY